MKLTCENLAFFDAIDEDDISFVKARLTWDIPESIRAAAEIEVDVIMDRETYEGMTVKELTAIVEKEARSALAAAK